MVVRALGIVEVLVVFDVVGLFVGIFGVVDLSPVGEMIQIRAASYHEKESHRKKEDPEKREFVDHDGAVVVSSEPFPSFLEQPSQTQRSLVEKRHLQQKEEHPAMLEQGKRRENFGKRAEERQEGERWGRKEQEKNERERKE